MTTNHADRRGILTRGVDRGILTRGATRGILTGILTGALALTAVPEGMAGGSMTDVIVRGASVDAVAAAVAAHGGEVEHELGLIGGVSAAVPAGALDALAATDAVTEVTPDGQVTLLSRSAKQAERDERRAAKQADRDERRDAKQADRDQRHAEIRAAKQKDDAADAGSRKGLAPDAALRLVGGGALADAGMDGTGIDVAVIDSGVKSGQGLHEGVNLLRGPNLSFDVEHEDGYGHGTAMASIIAMDKGNARGVAPDARIVDVKVADENGAADISQIIAGIDWVVANHDTEGRNIRVLNLSFGTDGTNPASTSPMAYAVEAAWRHGIVVVVSAGNHGDALGRLASPAIDPWVIAVGAVEGIETNTPKDDLVPVWSASGDGVRNPDFVAPGRSLLAARSFRSKIDDENPDAHRGDLLLGSGTSQAAAFTSGVAAMLLEADPTLTPDEVKALLVDAASDLRDEPAERDGAGKIALGGLYHRGELRSVPTHKLQQHAWSDGTGSLDGDRGSAVLELDGQRLTGEQTVFGAFDGDAWRASTWSGSTWSGSTWSGSTWSGSTWSGSTWSASTWSGSTWSGSTWSGRTWS